MLQLGTGWVRAWVCQGKAFSLVFRPTWDGQYRGLKNYLYYFVGSFLFL